ncbi:oligosaccharide flippase family protein [Cryobacterium sp. PAMC25264]|uniref:oligosaccharide flippase family protein n=1 Tax=Cryobacterium sp. PAMC25264 TaxID=2861288 RepID=UPI001C638002|nr:oligosaccharide flippase family protein [Cryobacterium sp. PAMC25264]QYF72836.1 oligosaccharide flippase family protein [Cryobacterium sp. PAMC25264]
MTRAEITPERSLRSRVKGGSAWGSLNVALSKLLQFLTTLILARILAPEQFGALAVALVAQTIALNITELGTTASIARGDRSPDAIAPTVFTLSLVTGAVLTLVMVLTAPWLAVALGDASATPVIQVMALSVILASFASVPTALVWRDFLQKRRLVVDIGSIVVTMLIAVPLAMIGWGAMALAWSRVIGQAMSTIGYWIIVPRRYLPGWNRAELPGLLRLGLPLAGANFLAFILLNVDYIIVGRQLGPQELGLYLIAFNLAALPSTVLTTIIRTVAVPAFGRLAAGGHLAALTPRLVQGIAWAAFPVCAMIGALGTALMTALYGERWAPAAVALLGLGVFGAARILSELFADLSVGAGRTGGLLWVQAVWLIALIPAMLLGVELFGIAGAGWAHAVVAWLVVVPLYMVTISRVLRARISAQLWAFLPLAAAAILAAVIAAFVASLVGNSWLALIAGGMSGLLAYVAVTVRVWRSLWREARAVPDLDDVVSP